jgi:hypothetical protein
MRYEKIKGAALVATPFPEGATEWDIHWPTEKDRSQSNECTIALDVLTEFFGGDVIAVPSLAR